MVDLSYMPSSSNQVNFFAHEPWFFYLRRLLELSPVYVFSFGAILVFSLKWREHAYPLLASAMLFSFFILWGNYQSRYLLPVVPFLLILASRGIISSWNKLARAPALRTLLCVLVLSAIFKGIIVGTRLIYSLERICYF